MAYRVSAANPPVDPESLRPMPSCWERFKVWFGCFINLTDHKWFRALCGGTWVHTSWYYADATYYQNKLPYAYLPQVLHNKMTWRKVGRDAILLCNWLPVLRLDDGREYVRYNHNETDLWVMVDTELQRRYYLLVTPDGRQVKLGGGVMAPRTIEKYPYSLKVPEACQFHPSLEALLTDWPDYYHLRELGVIIKENP